MAGETENTSTEETTESTAEKQAEKGTEKVATEVKETVSSAPQVVKVDLSELREALEGMPEKVADFIKEAVAKPKQAAKQTAETVENGNEKQTSTENRTPQSRGWLADFLFGKQ